MNKIRLIVICFLSAYAGQVTAQVKKDRIYFSDSNLINNAKVYAYGSEKKLAWCGGVNTPNFAMGDLNNDGKNDIVIYEDYQGLNPFFINGVRTFINRGTSSAPNYIYEPRYELNFPVVKDFIKLVDFNCDNIPDMVTWQGLKLFKGYYNGNNELCFTFWKDLTYFEPQLNQDVYINVVPQEVPSIEDVDHDGDPDIVAIGLSGLISLYKNMRTEFGLQCDSVLFKIKDRCWGRVTQGVQREHLLHQWCDNSGLKTTKTTHGANSFTLFDNDGDGDFDVLDGNFAYSDLQYLKNGRIDYNYPVDSMVAQDTTWQSNGRILYMPQFPASFWIDVDQDGLNDIIVSPHSTDAGENYKCVAYYRNTGSTGNYQYTYQSDTFLVDQMIDVGSSSYPTLYDYDKDGKPDLFVGSDGYFQNGTYRSRISYYKNTSTVGHISFELVTGDFLSLVNYEGAAPAMGDLDNDGKDDLVIGKSDGNIVYFKNMAASNNVQPVWQLSQPILKDITSVDVNVGYFAAPVVYDIDKDGKKDLIIGSQNGHLYYYKNVGNPNGTIMLQKVTETLGNVKADPKTFNNGFSTPFIGRLDDSNNEYLLVGSNSGALYCYDGFQSGNTTTPYYLKDSLYSDIRVANRTAPTVADIDGDNKMDMIIGNVKGGLNLYRQMVDVHVANISANRYQLEIYPNPAKNQLFMHLSNADQKGNAMVAIYNSVGQVTERNNVTFDNNTLSLDVSLLPAGVYLCYVQVGQHVYTGKFTKE